VKEMIVHCRSRKSASIYSNNIDKSSKVVGRPIVESLSTIGLS